VIATLIEQDRENRCRREVSEALAVEDQQQNAPLVLAQRQRWPRTTFPRQRAPLATRQPSARPIDPGPVDRQRHATRGDADLGPKGGEGLHQSFPSCSSAVGRPSKVHSFFWTSMMAFARSSWRRNRTISRVSCASRLRCATAGLAFGPRRGVTSAARSCFRQPDSIEEYTRSRRSTAPRSAGVLQRSYACKIRRFSAAEIVRRRLMARTSGFDTSGENLCAASDRLIDELTDSAAESELPLRADECIEFMGQCTCMLFN